MGLRHGCLRLTGVLALAAVGLVGFSATAFARTESFEPGKGSEQEFRVPAGVTQVEVQAVGGAGESDCTAPGGAGATVTATLAVLEGQTLYVDFGGGAQRAGACGDGSSGGGASDVRTESGKLSSRLVVAGGGGGGGFRGGAGGSASGTTGEAGFAASESEGGGGGGGGTSEHGGGAGSAAGPCPKGSEGELGQGGLGAPFTEEPAECAGGGGGGGGYYGGGGGGSGFETGGGGGGAGSSYITPEASGGSFASGAGLEQEVVLTYTAPPPACTAVNGVGHIAPKGKEGENLRVHLSTSGGTFRTTTPSGAAVFALRTLSSASCVAIPGGVEFSGRGAATMGGRKNTGYEMVFSFATEGAKTYLSLEVTKGATVVYKVTHEPLTKGSKVKIS